MASLTVPPTSCTHHLLLPKTSFFNNLQKLSIQQAIRRRRKKPLLVIFATTTQEPPPNTTRRQKSEPGVDTRIHWDNPDEGWVGGDPEKTTLDQEENNKDILADKFINSSHDSYYQFLGIPSSADTEEIKAAYRRLSKEYHPDTTSLPLKAALNNFMKLKEIYQVLTDDEKRSFYDWSLAQEAASKKAEKMRMSLEDPYTQDFNTYKPVPDMVDRLGGKNMPLGDQATAALTIDIFIIIFSFFCIIFAIYFKEY